MTNTTKERGCETATAETPQVESQLTVSPNVNIYETAAGYVLEADLPGVGKEGVDVSIEDRVLTITGRRNHTTAGSELYRESIPADYRRTFELDSAIDVEKITAKIEQGVLTVTLPKSEKALQRKVTING